MPDQETYTVPATTQAEREQLAEAARRRAEQVAADIRKGEAVEANAVQVDDESAPEQASDGMMFYVTPKEEIPYLLEEIGRLTRANAQLRVTCMKLLRERSGG